MKKILIGVLSVLLLVLCIVILVKGIQIGGLKIESIKEVKQKSDDLKASLDNANDLTKKTQIINRNRKQHISFKEDFVCIIDVDSWKEFKTNKSASAALGITPAAIEAQEEANNIQSATSSFTFSGRDVNLPWNQFKTMIYAASMCGAPYSMKQLKETTTDQVTVDTSKEAADKMINHFEKTVSVTNFIKDNDIPIIMGYGGMDPIVGIGQYARLAPALTAHSVENEFFYYEHSDHSLGSADDAVVRTEMDAKIAEWLVSK